MIDQIKNPSPGFEEVIRRHFYLKKDIILKEVGKWVKYGEVRPCTYGGLVSDHNYKYCQRFNQDSKKYLEELKKAIVDLEGVLKELQDTYEIDRLFLPQKALSHYEKKEKKKKEKKVKIEEKIYEGKVDVTYDTEIKTEQFDANDAKVADRWSRYIGAMGIDAVKKQTKAKVLLIGLNGLGLEVAKNLVLSGLQKLVLADWKNLESRELLENFYATEKDLG